MRRVGKIVAIAVLAFATTALAQSVWKWRDADGVVHYSDQPGPGAERVPLKAHESRSSIATPASSNREQSATAAAYKNLEIWKPADAETFTEGAPVSVGIRVEPALASGHSLGLYLDGRRVDSPTADRTEYNLPTLARGEHTLAALIADGKGQRVLASRSVKFVVQ